MDSNTSSPDPTTESHHDLAALTADLDRLATRDRSRLPATVRAQRVQRLRRLADRLEGHWLGELAESTPPAPPAPTTVWRRPRRPVGCATGCG
jgi:hypothetical protein